jgi:NADPH:quinone reductase-like Zn-dependent oxidoreductase
MAGAYNSYRRVSTDRSYRREREPHQMLLFPLFFTSFLIDDLLGDNELFGAEQVVVSSASSKTSIGVAFLAHARRGPRVVGLTSPGNAAFAEGLGVYDEVVTYDRADLVVDAPSVYVDVAGDRDVLRAVHTRLGDRLLSSLTVGATHWEQEPAVEAELPGPQPQFFFAPAQIAKRTQEWGSDGLDARIAEAWDRFATWCDGWLRFEHADGPGPVEAAYRTLLDGRVDPAAGIICSLHPNGTRRS